MTRRTHGAIKALVPVLAAIAVAWPLTALADPPPAPGYRQAVEDTITIIAGAKPGDFAAAQKALATLEAGTGHSQPEIIADLQMRPPDFADANTRLQALLQALNAPAGTSDPANAQHQLKQVLSMHRYDALHRPPGLLDRVGQWIRDRITDLLRLLFGGGGAGPVIPAVYFYILGAVAVVVAAVVIFRSTGGHVAEGAGTHRIGPRAPADFFTEADRLAASGDRVGAIRALCAGVAASLAGERTWEGSPLTVREIFQRAGDPDRLRPLLLPFEAAVYGGREIDAATYERAELAAAPFRHPAQEVAA